MSWTPDGEWELASDRANDIRRRKRAGARSPVANRLQASARHRSTASDAGKQSDLP